jgi:hypothetical protein
MPCPYPHTGSIGPYGLTSYALSALSHCAFVPLWPYASMATGPYGCLSQCPCVLTPLCPGGDAIALSCDPVHECPFGPMALPWPYPTTHVTHTIVTTLLITCNTFPSLPICPWRIGPRTRA